MGRKLGEGRRAAVSLFVGHVACYVISSSFVVVYVMYDMILSEAVSQ